LLLEGILGLRVLDELPDLVVFVPFSFSTTIHKAGINSNEKKKKLGLQIFELECIFKYFSLLKGIFVNIHAFSYNS